MLRKKVENEIFNIAALYGANICQIFFTARFNWSPKIFTHPSNYLLELQLIHEDLLA